MSAHLDDAILSAGGMIYDQIREGAQVEIWTFMCGVPTDRPQENYLRRIEEDEKAANLLGAQFRHFLFPDAQCRKDPLGEPLYSDMFMPVRIEDEGYVENLASVLDSNINQDDVVFCPLAVGGHVDHRVLREACERLIYPITYYTDFPYIDYVPEKLLYANDGLTKYPKTISKEGLDHWVRAVMEYKSQDVYKTPEITAQKIVEYWAQINGIFLWKMRTMEQIFNEIYYKNFWKDHNSVSGPGSTLVETEIVRAYLPDVIKRLGIHTMLDVPCGDYFWMRLVDLGAYYVGADIVLDLVSSNQIHFGDKTHQFVFGDITSLLICKADLILCRDCLVHFSSRDVRKAIENIKRVKDGYLLTTTFPEAQGDWEIKTGAWRPINLQASPYLFPPPLELIDEKLAIENYGPKCLGLWKIKDLP